MRLPVALARNGGEPVRTVTINVSSEGFFCETAEQFHPGEVLKCRLALAYDILGREANGLSIDGVAEVIRVVADASGRPRFGVACRLRDYHLVPNTSY